MTDPYSTLGVSPSASDEEIKKAYRDLARKYHPDNYQNNPLADLAQEKMKEINEAYDTITRSRANGGKTRSSSSYSSQSYSSTSREFTDVRAAINRNDLSAAERMLASISNRNAEWNFLMGSVYYKRGWFDEALRYYEAATRIEPNNAEYAQAYAYAKQGGYPYRTTGYGTPSTMSDDMCNLCTAMMCANLLCRCR